MKVFVSTAFYARADTVIQQKQVKQTSLEMH